MQKIELNVTSLDHTSDDFGVQHCVFLSLIRQEPLITLYMQYICGALYVPLTLYASFQKYCFNFADLMTL